MKRKIFIAALLLLLLAPASARASFSGLFCTPLYSSTANGLGSAAYLSHATTYTGILSFSLVIILAVLVVLGIVYAIGYAVRIDKLKNYTKTELLESVFNIIIIVAIVGGMALIDSGISFITGIVNTGISSASTAISAQSGSNVHFSTTTVSNAHGLYLGICNNYGSEIFQLASGALTIFGWNYLIALAQGFTVELMPNNGGFFILTPGFTFVPFYGLTVAQQVLAYLLNIILGLGAVLIGIPVLLFFIYYLFPFFLYAGVLFRSFPWTRAAGGTLLALFISFYIIFPSIIYPFSAISISGLLQAYTAHLGAGTITSATIGSSASLIYLGGIIDMLVEEISGVILQIGGLAIALVISYDLLEMFGKLLGAPSARANRLLSKVI